MLGTLRGLLAGPLIFLIGCGPGAATPRAGWARPPRKGPRGTPKRLVIAIMPGVVRHSTDFIEHPELIADRLVRYAKIVGRENVVAGTDSRLRQVPRHGRRRASGDQAALGLTAVSPSSRG